jgi:hypothetical protein
MVDFTLHGGPVEFLLDPVSGDGKDWVKLHIPEDSHFLGNAVVILRDYLDDILKGIDDDGLLVMDNRRLLS